MGEELEEMMGQGFSSIAGVGQGNIQHKFIVKSHNSWACCHEALMPALERLAQEDPNFETSLGYADSPRLA